jgi:hypothetical protein
MVFEDRANKQSGGFTGAVTTAITSTGSNGASNLVSLFIGSDGRTAKKEQEKDMNNLGS